jgi:hypothetical protein
MKSFNQYLEEQKQTYVIHGQAGEKFVTHEVEARSADHAKQLFKKAMKEKGHKYPHTSSVRTKDEEEAHKAKTAALAKEREEKIAKSQAERDKDSEYWQSRQKEYDKQGYKGE